MNQQAQMDKQPELIANNRKWAASQEDNTPGIFHKSATGQSPEYLWIGCSDSRVPPCRITGSEPGQIFVHRNVANIVLEDDANLQAALQYSVEALKVPNIVVCGHYRCGGVQAALNGCPYESVNKWVRPISKLAREQAGELFKLSETARIDRLCELNVLAQTDRLAESAVVRSAWANGQPLQLHSWIYQLDNGQLKVLREPLSGAST